MLNEQREVVRIQAIERSLKLSGSLKPMIGNVAYYPPHISRAISPTIKVRWG
ncbi:hypothetical protein PI95_029395 [Hassallia byssoidea VB512170]|uniref:Uncharacterized protein n=1 Tax=Hassallia byssoidea VB512170 TaxID=1304833 RepID=A0A846HHV0_9CYAN|nr:hypothetical protein [Hassalia byssoidea]NEU76518.1 hypothetical protein [Hassalia byssoidea VB512170]